MPTKNSEKLSEEVKKLRRKKKSGNLTCADCGTRSTPYVCTTFSTFICTPCSGIHRKFGHKVQSIAVGTFKQKDVDSLEEIGNSISNKHYLANYKDGNERIKFPIDPLDRDIVEQLIKSKYVDKKWYSKKVKKKKKNKKKKKKKKKESSSESENESEQEPSQHNSSSSDSEISTPKPKKKKKRKSKSIKNEKSDSISKKRKSKSIKKQDTTNTTSQQVTNNNNINVNQTKNKQESQNVDLFGSLFDDNPVQNNNNMNNNNVNNVNNGNNNTFDIFGGSNEEWNQALDNNVNNNGNNDNNMNDGDSMGWDDDLLDDKNVNVEKTKEDKKKIDFFTSLGNLNLNDNKNTNNNAQPKQPIMSNYMQPRPSNPMMQPRTSNPMIPPNMMYNNTQQPMYQQPPPNMMYTQPMYQAQPSPQQPMYQPQPNMMYNPYAPPSNTQPMYQQYNNQNNQNTNNNSFAANDNDNPFR